MIGIFLATIGIFAIIFLEHILLTLFSFSVFLLVVVNLWGRIDAKIFTFIVLIAGIALDVTFHAPLGLNVFIVGIVLLVYSLLNTAVPLDRAKSRYIALFFLFLFSYFISAILLSVFQDSVFPLIRWSHILNFTFNSVVSVFICILLDRFFMSLRDVDNYEKIRLR